MCFHSIRLWCHQLSVWFASAVPRLSEEQANGVAYQRSNHEVGVPQTELGEKWWGTSFLLWTLIELRDFTHHVHVSEFRASWRSEGKVRVCFCCQAGLPGFTLGSCSPSCPCRVRVGCIWPLLWRRTLSRGAQCRPVGNPAAEAPPSMLIGPTVLLGHRIPGQFPAQITRTACRYVCTDLDHRRLRKHSEQSSRVEF